MPYQIQLKRKDGKIRMVVGVTLDQPPFVGQAIEFPVDDQIVKARVSDVRITPIGAEIGQQLGVVEVEEI